jgi:hypothetical protein
MALMEHRLRCTPGFDADLGIVELLPRLALALLDAGELARDPRLRIDREQLDIVALLLRPPERDDVGVNVELARERMIGAGPSSRTVR